MAADRPLDGYKTSILPKSNSTQSSCSVVIYFDGTCGLCDRFVRFVLKRDVQGLIRFAPLQGKNFAQLLDRAPWLQGMDSLVVVMRVVNREVFYLRSRGVLMILSELGSPWKWFRLLKVIPAPILDLGYRLVSKLRYRLFGKHDVCKLPGESLPVERFLD